MSRLAERQAPTRRNLQFEAAHHTQISFRTSRASSSGRTASPSRCHHLKSWSAQIGGKRMQLMGYVEAKDEPGAIEAAVVLFGLNDERRKRLAVNLRR